VFGGGGQLDADRATVGLRDPARGAVGQGNRSFSRSECPTRRGSPRSVPTTASSPARAPPLGDYPRGDYPDRVRNGLPRNRSCRSVEHGTPCRSSRLAARPRQCRACAVSASRLTLILVTVLWVQQQGDIGIWATGSSACGVPGGYRSTRGRTWEFGGRIAPGTRSSRRDSDDRVMADGHKLAGTPTAVCLPAPPAARPSTDSIHPADE
jgi:hypothetical protein